MGISFCVSDEYHDFILLYRTYYELGWGCSLPISFVFSKNLEDYYKRGRLQKGARYITDTFGGCFIK
jgi:hypothetical protein